MSQSQMLTEKSEKDNEIDDNLEAEKTKNNIIDNHENYEIMLIYIIFIKIKKSKMSQLI